MTKKKILALVLTLALLFTQFSMIGVSAQTTALSGRSDFLKGVAIHRPNGYEAYKKPYDAIFEAKALGTNLIRTDSESDSFDAGFASIAKNQGMNVMFITSIDLTLSGKTSLTQEEYNKVYNKFYNKATALKDYNAYIQIDNELDTLYYNGGNLFTDGTNASSYNSVIGVALAINAANKAVKDANAANDSDIKTIVNFSANHYGFLRALKNVKIDTATGLTTTSSNNYVQADWDIIGLDFYSNMNDNYSYANILSAIKSIFGKQVIICESNLTPESKKADGTIKYAEDVDWLEDFVRDCYADTNVIGFVAYELYDQPAFANYTDWTQAHFGLIDKDGNKKAAYNTLCALYGGSGVVAERVIEDASEFEGADIEISKTGVKTIIPSLLENTSSNLVINLTEKPIDLSLASSFEFDLYIEDYEIFKKEIEGKRINFALSSDTNKTKNRIRFDIENQIKNTGWNHISIKYGSHWQCDSGFTYKNVKWAMIFFQNAVAGEYSPMGGLKAAIANFYAVKGDIDFAPAWPEYEHIKASEGQKNLWGKYSNTGSNFEFSFPEPVDLKIANSGDISYYDQVEFDIYIKDYDVFKAAAEGHELHFRIGYQASNGDWEYADMDIQDKITHSGWNHISAVWTVAENKDYNYNNFTDRHNGNGGKNFNPAENKVSYVKMYWNSNTSATVNEEFKNTAVRIANICFSLAEVNRIPSWPEYEHIQGSKVGKKDYWNSYSKTGSNFDFALDQPTDIKISESGEIRYYDQVEFDIYIKDYEAFKAAAEGHDLHFRIGYYDKTTSTSEAADMYLESKITHSGWNHVVLVWTKKGLTDYNNNDFDDRDYNGASTLNPKKRPITYVKLYWNKNTNAETNNEFKNTQVRISNICFSLMEIHREAPAWPEYEHIKAFEDSGRNYWGSNSNNDNFQKTDLGPIDASGTEQVEFDVYIRDRETFLNAISNKELHFRFGKGNNYVDLKLKEDQIIKNGWNHIKLVWVDSATDSNTDRISQTGTLNPKDITWIKLCWTGPEKDSAMSVYTRLANVCFTKKEINRIPEWPEYEHIQLLKDTGANYWGSDPGKNFIIENLGPLNVKNTDHVEFDIYVENYDSYMGGLSGKDIFLRLSSPGSNYIDVKIDKDQITKSGWNHIKLVWVSKDVNPDSDRYSSKGTFNCENITWIKFHCNSGVQWDTTNKTRMANVCFTNSNPDAKPEIEIPTEVMEDKFDFIGAELKTVEFDSEGISKITYGLNEPIDMSGDNMMLELDVFVENSATSEFIVELFDSNDDNMAVYEFNGLTDGWNRLAIRSTDCTDGDGNATEIDFSDIVAFDFVGAANTEVIVSNFYAANYIDGDGNRDGLLDIIDLVAMKKYAAGSTLANGMVGNKVAMDVKGDDYLVNAQDLSALRYYFLTDKWPEN